MPRAPGRLREPFPALQQAFSAMVDVTKSLLRPLNLSSVLEQILTQVHNLFGYEICCILLADENKKELYIAAQRGYDPSIAKGLRLPMEGNRGIVSRAAASRIPHYAPDVSKNPHYIAASPGVRSEFAVPLVLDDEVIGVLDVESREPDAFPREIRKVLEAFAALAALAIYRAQRHEELEQLALTDGLTGLANSRAFWEALHREIARAKRFNQALTLLVLEIDNFKRVNDSHGHLKGDEALRAVGRVLGVTCRAMDIAARVGGDEFAVIFPQTGKPEALMAAKRIHREVKDINLGPRIRLTASLGLAAFPEDGGNPSALFAAADWAMYRIKNQGGDGVAWVPPPPAEPVRSADVPF
ncbi:MAG: sensor domain-containing diguanylate cyclase [Firmicutes bacterium]|nr:sensor domain-containing diguanylate cyclase [Bacillota bacterium]